MARRAADDQGAASVLSSMALPLRSATKPRGSLENQNHCGSVAPLRNMNWENCSEPIASSVNSASPTNSQTYTRHNTAPNDSDGISSRAGNAINASSTAAASRHFPSTMR